MNKHTPVVAASPLTTPNFTSFAYESLEEAFPTVDPGVTPLGYMGVFQIRHPKLVTRGGIILAGESGKTEHYNTQVAKVISLGPLCFKTIKPIKSQMPDQPDRDVIVDWPEGAWFKVGDYVRVPRYGGDRFFVSFTRKFSVGDGDTETVKDQMIFAFFAVKSVLGLIPDPLSTMAYID